MLIFVCSIFISEEKNLHKSAKMLKEDVSLERKKKPFFYGSTADRKAFILFSIVYTVSDELMTSSCGKTLIMANEKGCVLVNCNGSYSVYHVRYEHFTGGLH